MATDNRANEQLSGNTGQFTEAQVEAAAKALHETRNPWIGAYGDWGAAGYEIKQAFRESARAALVAAQGAAPVAADLHAIDPPLHPDEREPIALNPLLRGVDLALDRLIRRDCFSERTLRVIDELRDELTHQPLPSSGVDVDALAEVLSEHVLGEPNGGTASWAWLNCSCGHRIEIAGVTREHVVELGRKHQARAVAEWLRSNPTKSA